MPGAPTRSAEDDHRRAAAEAFAAGLLGVCAVGEGLTAEQRAVAHGLTLGWFGVDVDLASLRPVAPDDLVVADPTLALRFVESAITLELCRHPPEPAMADQVERAAAHLGVELDLQHLARDYLRDDLDRLVTDYARHHDDYPEEVGALAELDADLAAQQRALADCPPGSLGRAFFEFHVDHGFAFAGEEGGGPRFLVPHDFTHVIADYPPDRYGEVAVNALSCAASGGRRHFTALCASIALFEGGLSLRKGGISPEGGALASPQGVAMLADAIARGVECDGEPMALDHLALADVPLEEVRASVGLRPRQDGW